MENILENLNKEQLDAAKTTKGALLILAGAGSGKTKVLTSRIAYMIQNGAIAGKIYQPKLIKAVISNAKNKMQDAYTFATFARDFKSQNIAKIFEYYENTLNNNNAIDFDDMLMLCVKLLEQNAEVRKKYYDKFHHILVDEYQDTNQAQYQLVKALYTNLQSDIPESRSLCVVGDVDQSIYSWRGADFRIIMNFQNDFPNAKLVKLEQNYRSTANILNAANAIIENNEERVDKVLYSQKGDGEKISLYEAQDEADEANYIVKSIRDTSDNYNQFSILYRTNAQSRALEEALIAAGIPYRIYGGLKFYDRKEIKDAIAYLKLIYTNDDSQSLRRIINGTATKLKDFMTLIDKLKEAEPRYSLPEFLSLILEKSGYLRELTASGTDEDQTRIENLQELVNVANEFEPEELDNTLGEFLSQVSLVSDIDGMDEIANNVTLMTLHASKGLEFPIVFLAGCDEGIFPSARCSNSLSELEEERRLMYVGVTRAETKLYLTTAKRRQMWGEYKYYSPSRFLEEIPSKLIEQEESAFSEYTAPKSTFTSAVKKVQSNKDGFVKPVSGFGSNFVAPGSRGNTSSTGFGKDFVAPSQKKTTNVVKRTPSRVIINKSPINKAKEEEKIKAFFEDNIMKRKLEEKKRQDAEAQQQQKVEEELKNTATQYFFNVGERVFHDKLGVGQIADVIQIGDSTMYTIDFGKMGKKAMDAAYAHLKKF